MSGAAPRRRFRVACIDPGDDGAMDPGPGVHRHLRVLRAAVGDAICLFDGDGREVHAEIIHLDDAGARVRIVQELERKVESPLATCLVQAVPARAARMETIVRQVTELGVTRIVPVVARRSQRSKAGAAARRRLAQRWRRIADSAAEQCGRTRVPEIDDLGAFEQLAWETLPAPLLIAHPDAEAGDDGDSWLPPGAARAGGVTVLVGPEGGWDEGEVAIARQHGGVPIRLGPRILRADTAGAVALTLLQYLLGDLR